MTKRISAVVLVLVALVVPIFSQTTKNLAYPEFKQRFQLAALQNKAPFSLADSLIQEGKMAASMQVFFTKDSDMQLFMTPGKHEIQQLIVTISGQKTGDRFNDMGYALSVISSLEDYQNIKDAQKLLQLVFDLPIGKKYISKSGFQYLHPASSSTTTGFIATNPKLEN